MVLIDIISVIIDPHSHYLPRIPFQCLGVMPVLDLLYGHLLLSRVVAQFHYVSL